VFIIPAKIIQEIPENIRKLGSQLPSWHGRGGAKCRGGS